MTAEDVYRKALALIISNEGGCETINLELEVRPCRERFPEDDDCWCPFCVATFTLENSSKLVAKRG